MYFWACKVTNISAFGKQYMSIITLTSDYGSKDPFSGIWKGILYSQNQDIQLVDITHSIAPANFFEAAYIINSVYPHYPKGTVHIIAMEEMDSRSVGYLAMKKDGHCFIAPDNGILSLIKPEFRADGIHVINIDSQEIDVSGMMVMSKAAIYLSENGALSVLGNMSTSPRVITSRKPIYFESQNQLQGHIIYIDRRGNLVTNIDRATFLKYVGDKPYVIPLPARNEIRRITKSFREIAEEAVTFALFNHNQLLEIGINGGSYRQSTGASHLLGLSLQDRITIDIT